MIVCKYRVGGANNKVLVVVGPNRSVVLSWFVRVFGGKPEHTCWFDADSTITDSTGEGTDTGSELRLAPSHTPASFVWR